MMCVSSQQNRVYKTVLNVLISLVLKNDIKIQCVCVYFRPSTATEMAKARLRGINTDFMDSKLDIYRYVYDEKCHIYLFSLF